MNFIEINSFKHFVIIVNVSYFVLILLGTYTNHKPISIQTNKVVALKKLNF